MSTGSAFTFHIPHSTPFRDESHFRTPLYARWLVVVKDAPMSHPTWENFQAAALANGGKPARPKHKQMPMQVSTVKTIAGLSKQAQAQLAVAPKSISIDSLSGGHRRSRNKKAAI